MSYIFECLMKSYIYNCLIEKKGSANNRYMIVNKVSARMVTIYALPLNLSLKSHAAALANGFA